MTTHRTWITGAALLATIALYGAQQPSAKFTELQRHDLTVANGEGVTMVIEIPVGGASARHSAKYGATNAHSSSEISLG